MTKPICTYVVLAVLIGTSSAFAQSRATKTAPPVHKVGLVDMEEVFKNYDKFTELQKEFKAELQQSQLGLQRKVEALKRTQKQLQDKTLKKGGAKFIALEANFTEQKAALDAEVQNSKRTFQRREAQIYRTVYGEVQDLVGAYSKRYGFSLVMRFRRPKVDSADPQAVVRDLSRSVIYYDKADDITDNVIRYLNKQYSSTGTSGSSKKVRQAGATAPVRTRTARPTGSRR